MRQFVSVCLKYLYDRFKKSGFYFSYIGSGKTAAFLVPILNALYENGPFDTPLPPVGVLHSLKFMNA